MWHTDHPILYPYFRLRCHVCAVTCFPPVSCLESNFCVDSCLIMAQVIMYRLQALKHFEKGHKINSEELNQSIIHKNENIISYNNYSATFISFLSRPVNSWYRRFALKQVSHNLTKRCTPSYVYLGCSFILVTFFSIQGNYEGCVCQEKDHLL